MVDQERLARLLRRIADDVGRLRDQTDDLPGLLLDEVRLDHVKYRFVTAIEACIDVAMHVGATEGFATPDTNADAVRALATRGIIDAEVAETIARAVGFRNVLVHRYAEVDDRRVTDHLADLEHLEVFVDGISARFLGPDPGASGGDLRPPVG
jgi:uncharacterized protein YutE (UPF0331/DUF86 family)